MENIVRQATSAEINVTPTQEATEAVLTLVAEDGTHAVTAWGDIQVKVTLERLKT